MEIRRHLYLRDTAILKRIGGGKASPSMFFRNTKKQVKRIFHLFSVLEHIGFEPTASTMRMWRAPSCANAPNTVIILQRSLKVNEKIKCLISSEIRVY